SRGSRRRLLRGARRWRRAAKERHVEARGMKAKRGGFVLLVLALARGAAAEGASKLEEARDAYWKLDYETAKTLAEQVLATRGLGHADFVEATKIDALSLAALGREEAARDAFVALLESNPQYELDTKLGPRFRTPYFEARDYWRAQGTTPAIGVAYRSE